MKGDRRATPITVPVLATRPAMPDILEAKAHQQRSHFARLQNWQRTCRLRDLDGLQANKLPFQFRIAVFEKHRDDFSEVHFELIQRGPLTVSSRPARNRANKEARFRITFDDNVECVRVLDFRTFALS